MRDIKGEFFCILPKWENGDELTRGSLLLYKISMRNTMQFVYNGVIMKEIMSTAKEQLNDIGFWLTVAFPYSHNSKCFDCKEIDT